MLARHRAKDPNDSSEPPTAPNGGNVGRFPLSYRDGLSQWWAGLSPAVTEHKVLSFIPYLQQHAPTHEQTGRRPSAPNAPADDDVDASPELEAKPFVTDSNTDPYGPRRWRSDLVQLKGKNRYLNEFSVERVGEDVTNNLVMLHGYGAGLGFFYRNFDALSRLAGWKLYALDLLGMGRSSRPPFRIHAKTRQDKITEAESWFVDSLEEWRVKKGIDRFTLLGHSLGGYMAVAYALKYPGHLNKLILASPVGIPEDPYAVNAEMPEPEDSTMGNEFVQNSNETTAGASKPATTNSKQPQPRKPLPKWLTTLWDANISPFSIVRLAGPLGPRLVSGWTSRRFNHLPADQAQALHDYSYSLFRQTGSGEYALAYILAPGAFARSPLIRRVQGIGRQWITDNNADAATQGVRKVREAGVPVVFMYGENDWMDVKGGHAAVEKMQQEKQKVLESATSEEKERDNGDAKVVVIRKAGHHVYLDSADHFNEVVTDEMRDVEKREKRLGFQK
ncbi:alpha/beta-hydrolase [Myriangium duriaei CBS 260.36]|uniref:Alpha/beta-hydrolase n=1 Tax=Myriangium duriaei CBS 260.36 TaxID=1168546 RepID=A0A9P4MH18_9PEZI|nr:alpha/beta-hydrolase [Myriangium duriaei CBS 260.36]